MCYHTEQKATTKELKDRFKATFPKEGEYTPELFINGFSHPLGPIITNDMPDTLQLFQWGFIPHYERNIRQGNTLNAVFETLNQRITYKNYISQRCLVPVTGMYEWNTVGNYKEKKKYSIENQFIFCLAGLWNRCTNPATNQLMESYTLVTKDGTAAILKDEELWLSKGELLINPHEIITHCTPPQLGLFGEE